MSASINLVILVGRITKQPAEKNGSAYTTLVTNDYKYTDGESKQYSEFHFISTANAGLRDKMLTLSVGDLVLIEGHLHYYHKKSDSSYSEKQTSVVVTKITMLNKKSQAHTPPSSNTSYPPF